MLALRARQALANTARSCAELDAVIRGATEIGEVGDPIRPIAEVIRIYTLAVHERVGRNQSEAARALGIPRSKFRRWLRRFTASERT
jgi:DNA-binding NtrC family response regulator